MPVASYTITVDHPESVDPGVLAQIAQLTIVEITAITTKNIPLAIATGIQIASLVASLFVKTPAPPTPVVVVPPSPLPHS